MSPSEALLFADPPLRFFSSIPIMLFVCLVLRAAAAYDDVSTLDKEIITDTYLASGYVRAIL